MKRKILSAVVFCSLVLTTAPALFAPPCPLPNCAQEEPIHDSTYETCCGELKFCILPQGNYQYNLSRCRYVVAVVDTFYCAEPWFQCGGGGCPQYFEYIKYTPYRCT